MNPSPSKKLLLGLLAAGMALAVMEGLLALAGVRPVTANRDPFVGFESSIPLFVPERLPGGGTLMVTAENKKRFFNDQSFRHPKPAGTFRIFCMGGSTTYGHPYRDEVSFPGWMRELLRAAAPGVSWDVINCGGISYASYREAALMEELARYEPDVFIVVNGHNEFLEKRTYAGVREEPAPVRAMRRMAGSLRIYAALDRAIAAGRGAARNMLPAEVSTMLDESVGPDAYERDDALRDQVVAHYRLNLERMVRIARDAGANILLVTPASQLRDCAPFKSEGDAAPADVSLADLREFADRDPRHAANRYRLAGRLMEEGMEAEAAGHFIAARDEDIVPLRALTSIGDAVRDVARETGAPMCDFESIAAEISRARTGVPIPGAELFTDHVHLTMEGYRLLALSLISALNEAELLPEVVEVDNATVARLAEEIEGRQDGRATGLALRNLAKTLSWAGKSGEAARLAAQAMEFMGEDAECHFVRAVFAAEQKAWADAEHHYRRALELEPGYGKAQQNLAIVLTKQGRDSEAIGLYENLLRRDPNHPNVAYNLALAYERTGAITQAVHYLRIVVRDDPADAEAREMLEELAETTD